MLDFHDDVASIRRELIMEGLFVRTPDGVYKKVMRGKSAREGDEPR